MRPSLRWKKDIYSMFSDVLSSFRNAWHYNAVYKVKVSETNKQEALAPQCCAERKLSKGALSPL